MGENANPAVVVGSHWRHKSGRIYQIFALTNTRATDPRYPVTVAYRDEHGIDWSRPLSTWHESMVPA